MDVNSRKLLFKLRLRKTNTVGYHLYMKSKKNNTNECICKAKTDSQIQKTTCVYQRGEVRGRGKRGAWD